MSNSAFYNEGRYSPPSLSSLCIAAIIRILESNQFSSRVVNELCKSIPDYLLDPILEVLHERRVLTDVALLLFLVPTRPRISLPGATYIKNSTLKQIGMNCRSLIQLDLSDCAQVTNAVVRSILQGCTTLHNLKLDRCVRVTDSAFDPLQSPFEALVGCLSLEAISLQGCPQVTGDIVTTLNKLCGRLKYLNLSQCKQVTSPAIKQLFEHHRLRTLNLAFIENISDDIFLTFPMQVVTSTSVSCSPIQILDIGKSRITDVAMSRMAYLRDLQEIRLQWCDGITDIGIEDLTINCPNLKVIDLKSCLITDQAVRCIAQRSKHLRVLDLSWCSQLTDSSMEYLAFVADCNSRSRATSLHHLSIVWCGRLSRRGVLALLQLPSLKTLEASGCPGAADSSCLQEFRNRGIEVMT